MLGFRLITMMASVISMPVEMASCDQSRYEKSQHSDRIKNWFVYATQLIFNLLANHSLSGKCWKKSGFRVGDGGLHEM